MSSIVGGNFASQKELVESWKPSQHHRRITLPELLQLRQTCCGLGQQRKFRGKLACHPTNPHHIASTSYLSYRAAWNPTRLQNAILVVGPGTPASTMVRSPHSVSANERPHSDNDSRSASSNESSSNETSSNHSENSDQGDDEDSEEPEEAHTGEGEENLRDTADDSNNDEDSRTEQFYDFVRTNHFYGEDSDDDESRMEDFSFSAVAERRDQSDTAYRPSMRHGGCINTAAWLTTECGWRLSTVSDENASSGGVHAVGTEEVPSQVVTSGDDRLLKVWDVSEAMGMVSPLAGGTATLTPFSSSYNVEKNFYKYKEEWQSMYDARRNVDQDETEYRPPGTVRLLTTVPTGHRGNVFHVTPLKGRKGVFATCGADGFLRLVDIERSGGESSSNSRSLDSSTVVIHPMYDHNSDGNGNLRFDPENPLAYFLRNSNAMCFSHHMLDDINVGLLCSERGLLRFDLRLSPREQCTKSLLPTIERINGSIVRPMRACKACAVLPTTPIKDDSSSSFGEGSNYVFAGGASRIVTLCDLRMSSSGQRSSRALQYYCPRSLSDENHVSVSGLDLSRDGKELLVSYESDQIYTFPVFPDSQSPRRSVTDQLAELLNNDYYTESKQQEADHTEGERRLPGLSELAAYGAHFNRLTFLKNARYAGPRDEYICTGSDSGRAWIYEKATGAVVAFWNADNSTCNGVVPHPTLPIFVTYGIDSTAKLWRATTPVDPEVDDSVMGRRKHFREKIEGSYEISPTVQYWNEVQSELEILDPEDRPPFFPDQILPCKALRRGRLTLQRQGSTTISNDLHNLPLLLKDNLHTVIQCIFDGSDEPVESDVEDFLRRVSLIRLRHQADSLGLRWNPHIPWSMESRPTIRKTEETLKDSPEDHNIEPSELVPEHPSDWIRYDSDMTKNYFDFREYFCRRDDRHMDFYRDRYLALDERGMLMPDYGPKLDGCDDCNPNENDDEKIASLTENDSTEVSQNSHDGVVSAASRNGDDNEEACVEDDDSTNISTRSKKIAQRSNLLLAETVKTLKEGGNSAFKAGNLGLAVYRYDKAIQYGSVVYTSNSKMTRFDALLKNLVMARLNMALVLLNKKFLELKVAAKQATLAIEEISYFCSPEKSESREALDEALALKAKAHFRLGSVQYEMGDYNDSITSLEESMKATRDISAPEDNKPDAVVVRRLAQAKRELMKHTKRQRKKFKYAFALSKADMGSPGSNDVKDDAETNEAQPSQSSRSQESTEGDSETERNATQTESSPTTMGCNAREVTPINSPAVQQESSSHPRA